MLKLQNIQVIEGKGKFFHPFMQTILMFVGETLIGFVYLFEWFKKGKKETSGLKKPASMWIVLFPAVMDLVSTLLSYTALNMVDSSVWQISRGGNIIFTALLSRFFLKRIFSGTSILGCVLAHGTSSSPQSTQRNPPPLGCSQWLLCFLSGTQSVPGRKSR